MQKTSAARLPYLLLVLTGLALGVALVRPFLTPLGHDQAWGLYMGSEWLHGVIIDGDQLVELNPPFIVWFMSLPVILAHVLHLSLTHSCVVFFDAIFVGVTGWSVSLVRRLFPERSNPDLRVSREGAILGWVVALGMIAGFMLLVPREDIGERDQLTALMLMPYLLLGLYRLAGRRQGLLETTAIGVLGAVGLCLKPQYALIAVALEVVLLLVLRRRWFAAGLVAPLALTGVVVVYVAVVYLFYSQYFVQVVPAVRFTYYAAETAGRMRGIGRAKLGLGLLTLVALLVAIAAKWKGLRYRTEDLMFAGASVVALGVYLLQHKGFRYQAAPVTAYAAVALAWALVECLSRAGWPESPVENSPARPALWVPLATFGLALVVGLVFAASTLRRQGYDDGGEYKEELAQVYGAYPKGTAVSFFSYGPWEFPPVVEQEKVWGSRFMHTWWLPGVLNQEQQASGGHPTPRALEARRLGAKFRREYGEDLLRWKPAVVAYQPFPYGTEDVARSEGYADMMGWFAQDPLFQSQWAHYRYVGDRGTLRIYVRDGR